jgi:hypothetical protein
MSKAALLASEVETLHAENQRQMKKRAAQVYSRWGVLSGAEGASRARTCPRRQALAGKIATPYTIVR